MFFIGLDRPHQLADMRIIEISHRNRDELIFADESFHLYDVVVRHPRQCAVVFHVDHMDFVQIVFNGVQERYGRLAVQRPAAFIQLLRLRIEIRIGEQL